MGAALQASDLYQLIMSMRQADPEVIEAGIRLRDELWGLSKPGEREAADSDIAEEYKRTFGNISDDGDVELAAAITGDLENAQKESVKKSAELDALDASLSALTKNRSMRR